MDTKDIQMMKPSFTNQELNEFVERDENSTIEISLEEYLSVLRVFNKLLDAAIGEIDAKEHWVRDQGMFFRKLIYAGNSLHTLIAHGESRYESIPSSGRFIDVISVFVLLRTQIETVLTHRYIYDSSIADTEKKFRYYVWYYSGLKQLSKIAQKAKYKTEKTAATEGNIEIIKQFLQSSTFFNAFDTSIQKEILAGKWPRLPKNKNGNKRTWNDLLVEAQFGTLFFGNNLYGVLSNNAHSESLIRIFMHPAVAKKTSDNIDARMMLFISKLLLATCAIEIARNTHNGRLEFEVLPQEDQEKLAKLSALLHTDVHPDFATNETK